MTKQALRELLEHLHRMPNATPAEALAEFRRRVADLRRKAKKGLPQPLNRPVSQKTTSSERNSGRETRPSRIEMTRQEL